MRKARVTKNRLGWRKEGTKREWGERGRDGRDRDGMRGHREEGIGMAWEGIGRRG